MALSPSSGVHCEALRRSTAIHRWQDCFITHQIRACGEKRPECDSVFDRVWPLHRRLLWHNGATVKREKRRWEVGPNALEGWKCQSGQWHWGLLRQIPAEDIWPKACKLVNSKLVAYCKLTVFIHLHFDSTKQIPQVWLKKAGEWRK